MTDDDVIVLLVEYNVSTKYFGRYVLLQPENKKARRAFFCRKWMDVATKQPYPNNTTKEASTASSTTYLPTTGILAVAPL